MKPLTPCDNIVDGILILIWSLLVIIRKQLILCQTEYLQYVDPFRQSSCLPKTSGLKAFAAIIYFNACNSDALYLENTAYIFEKETLECLNKK